MALTCPKCGSERIAVLYSLSYRCDACGAYLRDANDPGIPVLTQEEARQKRPLLYGLLSCPVCTHKAHPPNETPPPLEPGRLVRREGDCGSDCPACVAEAAVKARVVRLVIDG